MLDKIELWKRHYTDPMQALLYLTGKANCSGAKGKQEMAGNFLKVE